MKCIICGKKDGDTYGIESKTEYEVFVSEHKFPHGSIPICNNKKCKQILTTNLWDKAYPVVWMGDSDLVDGEHLTEEEFEKLSVEELIEFAENVAELLWNGDFHEEFHDLIGNTLIENEKEMIKNTPRKRLPLLIGALKFDINNKVLESCLKGEKK